MAIIISSQTLESRGKPFFQPDIQSMGFKSFSAKWKYIVNGIINHFCYIHKKPLQGEFILNTHLFGWIFLSLCMYSDHILMSLDSLKGTCIDFLRHLEK